MGNFRKLRAWQYAIKLTVKINQITQSQPFSKDFGPRDQIRRSAISSNPVILSFHLWTILPSYRHTAVLAYYGTIISKCLNLSSLSFILSASHRHMCQNGIFPLQLYDRLQIAYHTRQMLQPSSEVWNMEDGNCLSSYQVH
jgi:hypothetical protein